jgi:hypothetical protein
MTLAKHRPKGGTCRFNDFGESAHFDALLVCLRVTFVAIDARHCRP